jgi:2-polyprenyl-3-methyl-5-hydroxy-6-metoxy-1,4-benzoquinol methylase
VNVKLATTTTDIRQFDRYFAGDRRDLLDWLGGHHERVLEIGCGAGGNSVWLRQHGAKRIVGIELDAASAEAARSVFDNIILGRVEDVVASVTESFDLVVCADVLEHLPDPVSVLASLAARLDTGGVLIASIPNIRHYRALARIAFGRGFSGDPEGVFDRTHLRFFTRANIREMLVASGLEPARWGTSPARRLRRIRGLLSRRFLAEYLTYQWFVAAVHPGRRRA